MVSRAGLFFFLAVAGLASPALAQVQDIGPRAPPSPSASATPLDCTDWEGSSLGRAGRSKVRLKLCVRERKVTGRIEFIGDAGGSERDVAGDVLVTGAMVLKDVRLIVKQKVPGWTPALIHRYDFAPSGSDRLDGSFDLDFNGWKDHGKLELTKLTADAGSPLPLSLPPPDPAPLPLPQPDPPPPAPSLSDHLSCRCTSVGHLDSPPGGWIFGALLGIAAILRKKSRGWGAAPTERGLSEGATGTA
jgi:hypothetical protein